MRASLILSENNLEYSAYCFFWGAQTAGSEKPRLVWGKQHWSPATHRKCTPHTKHGFMTKTLLHEYSVHLVQMGVSAISQENGEFEKSTEHLGAVDRKYSNILVVLRVYMDLERTVSGQYSPQMDRRFCQTSLIPCAAGRSTSYCFEHAIHHWWIRYYSHVLKSWNKRNVFRTNLTGSLGIRTSFLIQSTWKGCNLRSKSSSLVVKS